MNEKPSRARKLIEIFAIIGTVLIMFWGFNQFPEAAAWVAGFVPPRGIRRLVFRAFAVSVTVICGVIYWYVRGGDKFHDIHKHKKPVKHYYCPDCDEFLGTYEELGGVLPDGCSVCGKVFGTGFGNSPHWEHK
jgi:hypothetical protein